MRFRARICSFRKRLLNQSGLTLVELLVVILAAGILGGAILGVFLSTFRTFTAQGVRIQNEDSVRTGINQMTRYVRSATSSADHQATWSNAVASAQPKSLEFYCDVDGALPAEKVRFYLDGSDLRMQVATPTWQTSPPGWTYPAYSLDSIIVQQAVRNGATPLFTYLRYNGFGELEAFTPATSTALRDIVAVDITLIVNEVPELNSSDIQLSTRVQIRQRYKGGLE